jgi:hypothetical protein
LILARWFVQNLYNQLSNFPRTSHEPKFFVRLSIELELELIQTEMAQKPMLRAEVGMRVRCANKASAE